MLGSRRYWQGIDVRGDDLQAVVIEKLRRNRGRKHLDGDRFSGDPLASAQSFLSRLQPSPFRFQGQAQKDLEVDRVFDATSFRLTPPPSFLAQDAPTGLVPADDSSAYREGFPRLPWNRMFCTFTRWQGKRPHEHPDPAAPHCQP